MTRALLLSLIVLVGCQQRRDERVEVFVPVGGSVDATVDMRDGDIVHSNALGSESTARSLFWGLWLPTGLVLAFAALGTLTQRRRARRESDAAQRASLRNGPAVVQGRVETDGGDAITVTVTQRKRVVKGKNGHRMTYWDEKRREVTARPFRVRGDDGGVVEVVPDPRVHLRDKLEAPEYLDDTTRRRFVRLRPGERVWVSGVLSGVRDARSEGAYREAQRAPVMKRGFARMIVSTEPPGAHHRERADLHRGWFKGVLITLAVVHGLVLGDVTAQIVSGHDASLAITRTATWRVWVKSKNSPGRWERHCAVWARGANERDDREYEVRCSFHHCAVQGACRTLPTRRALLTADLLRDVGRGPTAHLAQVVMFSLVGWITLIAYAWSLSSSRPWYVGGTVDEGP